jgi:hypothetical protein
MTPLACGPNAAVRQSERERERAPAWASWAGLLVRPAGERGEGSGRASCWAAGVELGCGSGKAEQAKKVRGRENSFFSFSFLISKANFQMSFEFPFEFSNKSHNMKYYAVACMLKHVAKPYSCF